MNNTATGDGGAIWAGRHANLALQGCDFSANWAENGGAIGGYGMELAISDSTFRKNTAVSGGGAIFLEGGNASLSLSASVLELNDGGLDQGHTRVLQLYFNLSVWRSNMSERASTFRDLEER